MRAADPETLKAGVWTASTGNMAQGVAWGAREMGLECTVVVPDNAPASKLEAIRELGAEIVKIPRADWFHLILYTHDYPGMEGLFIHSASNREVMAGQGTIGVEIVENMPDVDAVITPFGGGGLTAGVASAVRALKPATRLCACELETGAPSVGADTWPILSSVVGGSLIMSVADLVSTIKLLVERNRGGRGGGLSRRPFQAARVKARSPVSCPAATSTQTFWPQSSTERLHFRLALMRARRRPMCHAESRRSIRPYLGQRLAYWRPNSSRPFRMTNSDGRFP